VREVSTNHSFVVHDLFVAEQEAEGVSSLHPRKDPVSERLGQNL
jgi:hypothetical protein